MTSPKPAPRLVVSLVYDGLWTIDFAMTTIFGLEWPEPDFQPYRFAVAGIGTGPVSAFGGFGLNANAGLELVKQADLLIIPGWRNEDELPTTALLEAIRAAHSRGTRIAALGVGVFVLAHAGLLAGRRAVTHWYLSGRLARRFRDIRVERNALYVQDGNIYTSGGSLSGIDMLLYIIRQDQGVRVANRYARRMIAPPHRDGSQHQLLANKTVARTANPIARMLEWMEAHLAERITVEMLANRCAMSRRTFMRRFHSSIGQSPMQWLALRRIRAAQEYLETSDRSVDWIAATTGFGSAELLRHHFRRHLGVSPVAWRKRRQSEASGLRPAE